MILNKRLTKKIATEWEDIQKGRTKLYHYNRLKDFEETIS